MTAARTAVTRWVRRAPHAIGVWRASGRVVQSARRDTVVPVTPFLLELLDCLDDWVAVEGLAEALEVPAPALHVLLDGLQAHDVVESATGDERPPAAGLPRDANAASDAPLHRWAAAALFHQATRDVPFSRSPSAAAAARPPRPPAALPPAGSRHLALPPPQVPGTLGAALRDRRTHRQFAEAPIRLHEVATLLGVTFGVQAWALADEGPLALKTSPSGGARHSLEAYVWARRVVGLPPGLYHYRPGDHVLTALDGGRPPGHVTDWLPAQDGYEPAPLVIVLASVLARVAWRYQSARAYRVVLIEAGHLGQTFCLTASGLGLAPFCTAAIADSAIEAALGLDGDHQPAMYVVGAGRPSRGPWQPHAGREAPALIETPLGRALGSRLTRRPRGPRRPPRRGHAR